MAHSVQQSILITVAMEEMPAGPCSSAAAISQCCPHSSQDCSSSRQTMNLSAVSLGCPHSSTACPGIACVLEGHSSQQQHMPALLRQGYRLRQNNHTAGYPLAVDDHSPVVRVDGDGARRLVPSGRPHTHDHLDPLCRPRGPHMSNARLLQPGTSMQAGMHVDRVIAMGLLVGTSRH